MATLEASEKCRFETQDSDETVILLLRAHLVTNLTWIIVAIFLSLIPLVFRTDLFDPIFDPFNIPGAASRSLALLWYLFVLAYIVQNILHWYFNVYILTNKRIVDIDFLQLLYKKISSTELANVQDITFKRGGVLQTLFNYGDVHIQTAGTLPEFEFLHVPHPDLVQDAIEKAKAEAVKP